MYLHVAVGAGGTNHALGIGAGQRLGTEGGVGVIVGVLVTLLTEVGHANLQHRGVVGPVRVMAIGAVVLRRAVLPEEWASHLRVAGVAGFIDRVLL